MRMGTGKKRENARKKEMVSVIIHNRNDEEKTLRLVDELESRLDRTYEIIVVDNQAHEIPTGLRGRKGLKFVQTPHDMGYAGSYNWASEHAHGDKLLFIHNDIFPSEGFLSEMVRHLESDPRIGAVGPKIYYRKPPKKMPSPVKLGYRPAHNQTGPAEYLQGACLLVSRDAFNAVGGMHDGYYQYFEDLDLSKKLRNAGYNLLQVASSRVMHEMSDSNQLPSDKEAYYLHRNRQYFVRKNFTGMKRHLHTAYYYGIATPKELAMSMVQGNFSRGKALWNATMWNLGVKDDPFWN